MDGAILGSGSRFFCIASQISDAVPQLTAAVLISSGFGKSQCKFKLLELMPTFNKA